MMLKTEVSIMNIPRVWWWQLIFESYSTKHTYSS